MAGTYNILYQQDFTLSNAITVTHNLDRYSVGIMVLVEGKSRPEFVNDVQYTEGNERNEFTVHLTSTQTGRIQVMDADYFRPYLSPDQQQFLAQGADDGYFDQAQTIKGVSVTDDLPEDGYGLKYNSITSQLEYEPFPRVFETADASARQAIAAIEGDEVIQSDDASQWLYDGYSWIKRYGFFANTYTVAQADAQFDSIKSAVDAAVAAGASDSNPYRIDVYPGTYVELPMTIPAGIIINALTNRIDNVLVQASNPDEDLFTCTGGYICGLEMEGVSNASKAIIRCATASTLVVLHGISFRKCSNGVVVSGGASCIATNPSINVNTVGIGVTTGFTVTGAGSYIGMSGGFFSVPAALLPFYASNPIQTVIRVTSSARFTVNGATFNVADKTTDADVFLCDGGSQTHIMGCEIRNGGTALHIGSSGSDTTAIVSGGIWEGNNLNGLSDSSTATIMTMGATDELNYTGAVGTAFSGIVQLKSNNRTLIAGSVDYWFQETEKELALSEFFHDTLSSGLACDGGVTDDGYGLFVTVASGRGYIVRHTPSEDAFDVAWDGYSVPLTANETNYVVYDSASDSLISQLTEASESQIQLAIAVTNDSGIRFLHQTRRIYHNNIKSLNDYLLQTRKIALKSGLAVSAGSTSYKFNVDSGTWYRATDEITVDGYSDAVFSYFYGTDGYTEIESQTVIDDGYYDNSGTLTQLTSGYYKADTAFITSDNKVSVLYGTDEYATQTEAEEAPIPTPPTFIEPTACRLAKLVSTDGYGIVEIVDIRPDPNAATAVGSGGGGGVTDHGALSGLADDDHTQYLLGSGVRAMAGDLNMGGNAVTNVGNVDGVDVSAHASRHNPGNADALTTASAVANPPGTSSAEGTNASFARSDHTHALADFGTGANTFCEGNDSRLSDDRTADGLRTATTVVSISAATAPTTGQVLVATSGTAATWQDQAGETLAAVQARRTTTLAVPATWTDISFDTTDIETDSTVIDHEAGTTDRITVKETDTYEITYILEMDSTSTGTFSGRVRVNDSTVINGSSQNNVIYTGESDIFSVTVIAQLTANDFLSVQIQTSTSGTLQANGLFIVSRMTGTKGDKGDTGAGSTVIVQDETVTVTGSPFDTLNFTGAGVTATDGGGGTVDITIPGGGGSAKMFKVVETTGGQSFTALTNVTFDGTPSPYDTSYFSWDGTDELTILQAGHVLLIASMSIQQTAGNGRTISYMELQKQPSAGVYAKLAGSGRYMYTRNSSDGDFGSMVSTELYTASVNDVVKVMGNRTSGLGTVVNLANDTNFIAIWYPST